MGSCFSKKSVLPIERPFRSVENTYIETEANGGLQDLHQVQKVYSSCKASMHRHVQECYEAVLSGRADTQADLDLRFTRLNPAGMMQVAMVLPFFTRLRCIKMWKTRFGPDGSEYLAKALLKLPLLRILSIEGNEIKFAGLLKLSDALKSLAILEELFLHSNQLGPDSGPLLAAILPSLTRLRRFTVDENELGDKGAVLVVESIANYCPSLVLLGLAYNGLMDVTAEKLLSCLDRLESLGKVTFQGNSCSVEMKMRMKEAKPKAIIRKRNIILSFDIILGNG